LSSAETHGFSRGRKRVGCVLDHRALARWRFRVTAFLSCECICYGIASEPKRSRCRGLRRQAPNSGSDDTPPLSPHTVAMTQGEVTLNESGVSQPVASVCYRGERALPYANASSDKARREYAGGHRTVSSGRTLCVQPARDGRGVWAEPPLRGKAHDFSHG
jgi:hypothetical protein